MEELSSWKITLFTSGTTGLPKKISHNFSAISRAAKISDKHKDNIWGFAYNPTHMAGLQVFFQALLNENTIVRLFNLSKDDIYASIKDYNITHISATPTFYKLMLPSNNKYLNVTRVTSGGEKFDTVVAEQIKHIFPNSKLLNVYALTETGSIFAAKGDVFTVKDDYINFVKIENGEVYLNSKLLGETNENILKNEWYSTGDMVEIVFENPLQFRFLSRKNEMINVGGYKVNPYEVEEAINKIDDVIDVLVYAKPNSVLGNIVCADIVANSDSLTVKNIRESLTAKIQEFKIPRIIRFVSEIDRTRSGKKKRL